LPLYQADGRLRQRADAAGTAQAAPEDAPAIPHDRPKRFIPVAAGVAEVIAEVVAEAEAAATAATLSRSLAAGSTAAATAASTIVRTEVTMFEAEVRHS